MLLLINVRERSKLWFIRLVVQTESENSSRRNKQAKKVKAQRGLYIGSHLPYRFKEPS